MDNCPYIDKRQEFEDEFSEKMKKIANQLEKLTQKATEILSSKKSPNKSEKEIILKEIDGLKTEIRSNVPFVYKQFNEQMDKTVAEAKGEFEGFVLNKVISLGLEGLETQFKLLGTDVED